MNVLNVILPIIFIIQTVFQKKVKLRFHTILKTTPYIL